MLLLYCNVKDFQKNQKTNTWSIVINSNSLAQPHFCNVFMQIHPEIQVSEKKPANKQI